ncbi:MAG: hypothetical protein KF696_00865 [Planctomycetes bacterium]|nr:hypothetical protein [Planctomycetota bacterium]MCW8134510.1 hypothetical protein [Planctomycetota bacterium]
MTCAEIANLFRHALLRDGAYQLMSPGSRSSLHLLAADILEDLHPQLGDAVSQELVAHLQQAANENSAIAPRLQRWLRIAARYAESDYQPAAAAAHWRSLANLCRGTGRLEALYLAAEANIPAGLTGTTESGLRTAIAEATAQ